MGILLYYSYAAVDNPQKLKSWLESISDGLVGRVRISKEGVNGTLGGDLKRLEQYVEATRQGMPEIFAQVDFKLDELKNDEEKSRICDERLKKETGFDALRHRVVDEIVTYRQTVLPRAKVQDIHRLDHSQWDKALKLPQALVIDCRNRYESSIGRFVCPPDGAQVIYPDTRCTSDMTEWLATIAQESLKKSIYLYCTGGVRCERAADFLVQSLQTPVSILEGGIVNYLKATSEQDCRFFGRLFVFDPRVSIQAPQPLDYSLQSCCVGPNCRGQKTPVCDYCLPSIQSSELAPPRPRCVRCRVLVLACNNCASSTPHLLYCKTCSKSSSSQPQQSVHQSNGIEFLSGCANWGSRQGSTLSFRVYTQYAHGHKCA